MTFFPAGSEDFNVPVAWSRSHQRKAGNPYSDQLFTVLLSSKDNLPGSFSVGVPTLQVRVLCTVCVCFWTVCACTGGGKQPFQQPAAHCAAVVERQTAKQLFNSHSRTLPNTHNPLQVLPQHPLLQLGASEINETCRGGGLGVPPLPKTTHTRDMIVERGIVVTVPRVRISYVINPVTVPEERGPGAIDKFTARYGAANATVNPDMAEAELTKQISKLKELTESSNSTVAEKARKALRAYEEQQRVKAAEEAEALAVEAAWYKPRQVRGLTGV